MATKLMEPTNNNVKYGQWLLGLKQLLGIHSFFGGGGTRLTEITNSYFFYTFQSQKLEEKIYTNNPIFCDFWFRVAMKIAQSIQKQI